MRYDNQAGGNRLFFGDNLEVLRGHIKDESVDLVYLDPPFNSKANYNVLFKERSGTVAQSQAEAFCDTWTWGPMAEQAFHDVMASNEAVSHVMQGWRNWLRESAMMAYLAMMAVRLTELRRVLKPSGSLYLHCDPVASHYLKIALDAVFGAQNFRSEIIWRRAAAHNSTTRQYGPIHDTILFYSKTDKFTFHPGFSPYTKGYMASEFTHRDESGVRFRVQEITGAGPRTGDSGKPWRGYDPTSRGRHWAIPSRLRELLPDKGNGLTPQDALDALDAAGWLVVSRNGRPKYKQYAGQGVPYQDIWAYQAGTSGTQEGSDAEIDHDVKWLDDERERLGYPTQKPIGLLARILSTSTDPGDTVLDPFCGCGTTVQAAEQLDRKWIGIDVTHYAITLIEQRLKRSNPNAKFTVHGRPASLVDAEALAKRDKHQFQWWAAWFVGAQSYREEKRGPDRGIDGSAVFANGPFGYGRIIISVKGGENVGVDMVRQLRAVLDREKAEMGILITLAPPTQPMINEALGMGYVAKSAHGRLPRLQIVTAADLFAGRLPAFPPLPQALNGVRPRSTMPRRIDKRQLSLMLAFNGSNTLKSGDAFVDPRYLTFGVQGDRPNMPDLPLETAATKPSSTRRPSVASHKGSRSKELPLDVPLLIALQPRRRRV